jgi:branched-chain amino acid transport system substrate-binding protein
LGDSAIESAAIVGAGDNAAITPRENGMTKRIAFASIFAATVAAGLLAAGTASAQVKFGVGGPITGGSAAFGAQLKNGAEQAVADINAAGGILGQKITISQGDDRADPKEGVSVANKFAADGVKFVIGHFNSGVTMPASEVYQENGILEITPASTNPQITERKMWNVFRTCGRDDQQGTVAGNYILKNFKGKKIVFIHDKTTYGKGLADSTRATVNKGGLKDVLYEGINKDDKDFSAVVSKVKASGADLIFWGGLHDTGGLLLRQMRDQGIKAPLMGGDGITSDEFASIGGPGVEGTLMTYGPDPRKRPEAKDIVAKFRAKNFEPEAYTLYSYAAVQIIKQAAEAAKSLDPKKVAEQMRSGQKFSTVIGDISYDKKGDITRLDYVMYVWKKNAQGKITYEELAD